MSKVVNGGREGVVQAALELAKSIAMKSPVAVASTKRLLIHARDHSVAANLEYTSIWNGIMLNTEVFIIELHKAAWLADNVYYCSFTGRRDGRHGSGNKIEGETEIPAFAESSY